MTRSQPITMRALVALAALSVAGLAACTTAGASTAPSDSASLPPAATTTAKAGVSEAASEPADASAAPSAVATSIDPCQLVTQDDVATLVGFPFGPSSSTTMDNNGRVCEYGQEGVDVTVIVVQAPDAATAKSQEPAFKAQLEQAATDAGIADMKLTELPDFLSGVDAAILHGTTTIDGTEVGGVAFYALKGPVLLAMTELTQGGAPVTDAEMEAQAKTALGRIP